MSTFKPAFKSMRDYHTFKGWRTNGQTLIPTAGGALELFIDPSQTLGLPSNRRELLGGNIIDNGDFRDFTMEDDANSIGHYIFDDTYVAEDGNESICSERGGSETELLNVDCQTDTNEDGLADGWLGVTGATSVQLVSGNGFSGYAQEMVQDQGSTSRQLYTSAYALSTSKQYRVRFWYRASNLWTLSNGLSKTIPANTGDAEYIDFIVGGSYDLSINVRFGLGSIPDAWLQISYVEIIELPANSLFPSGFSDGFEDELNEGGVPLSSIYNDSLPLGSGHWIPYGNNSRVVDGTEVTTTYVDTAAGASLTMRVASNTTTENVVIGKTYRITLDIKSDVLTNGVRVYSGTAYSGYQYPSVVNEWVTVTLEVVPTGVSPFLYIILAAGSYTSIDNILIQEVAPSNPAYENGGALEFNGVDTYFNGGDIHDLGTGDFSIEAWVKLNDYANGSTYQMIVSKFYTADDRWFFGFDDLGYLHLYSDVGNVNQLDIKHNTATCVDGQWHHIAVSVERAVTAQIYIDGVAVSTTITTNTAVDMDNIGDFKVGGYFNDLGLPDGYIAEVRISDVARTITEIKQSYGSGKGWTLSAGDIPDIVNDGFALNINSQATYDAVYSAANYTWEDGTLFKLSYRTKSLVNSGRLYIGPSADYFNRLATDAEWVQVTGYFLGDGNAGRIYMQGRYSNSEAWFDDIKVQKVLNASTPDTPFVEDFSQGGAKYAANEVVNGGFDTDSKWVKTHSNWTISGGSANCDGLQAGNALINQAIAGIAGKLVKVSFDITALSAGTIRVYAGSTSTSDKWRDSVGSYSEHFLVSGTETIYIWGDPDFVGSVDNVRLEEVTNGNHGMMQNDMEDDQPTHPYGFELVGVSESIEINDRQDQGNDDFLTTAWVKTTAAGTEVFIGNSDDSSPGWLLFWTTTSIYFRIENDIGTVDCSWSGGASALLADGKWHFIAVGRKDNTYFLYTDSNDDIALRRTYVNGDSISPVIHNFRIGGRAGVMAFPVEGKVGVVTSYLAPNGLPSNYETSIIKKIYDNTKGFYEDE